MSYVFISYKREDEVRVGRLARALEKAGLSIWWDRGLPGAGTGARLAQPSRGRAAWWWSGRRAASATEGVRPRRGPAGDGGVLGAGRSIEKIPLPLGFGELQAIDLSDWRGSPRSVLPGLGAAVKAKFAGHADAAAARGRRRGIARRVIYGATSSALSLEVALLGFNTFGVSGKICTMPGAQPGLSDSCGALHLGGRPTREERLAWCAGRGDCQALRAHIDRFPDGAYRSEAVALSRPRRSATAISGRPPNTACPCSSLPPPIPTRPRRPPWRRPARRPRNSARGLAPAPSSNTFRPTRWPTAGPVQALAARPPAGRYANCRSINRWRPTPASRSRPPPADELSVRFRHTASVLGIAPPCRKASMKRLLLAAASVLSVAFAAGLG